MLKNRMLPLDKSKWTSEQETEAQKIIDGPRGKLLPPFEPLLRSPKLMQHVQSLGEYLRYSSAIGQRLTELAILVTARNWDQAVEWSIHAPLAIQEGINPSDIESINNNTQPKYLKQDELAIYHFCQDLHKNKCVSDNNWNNAINFFGEKGTIDLIAINGYYTLLAMIMNASQTSNKKSEYNLIF
ncbi:carboxymuconolactone decarboxylase family protein [Acinetobacter nectaris]|uniref:carboxymuconolactone decarboxylase family protein n=1 Tax=Acinetobacter nectaris TaxID=1219382 RepID=UPI001F269BE9|nr:carboxymuconolactone decarboxylase family protein [Acinetobacter nectaris]MCF9047280.1 carboxymuconolactone decarboxylase family protein [Acinetobacter nectaris]